MDALPGGVKHIQIPLFKNITSEPGAEFFFTNALKLEALRSNVARVENEEANAEAILQGTIASITVIADDSVLESENNAYLPKRNVLLTQYKVFVSFDLTFM